MGGSAMTENRSPPASTSPDTCDFAGIASLPVEILARCFFFLAVDFHQQLVVLHVSRTWRAVALDFPDVWSHIHISNVTQTRSVHFVVDMLLSAHPEYPFDFSAASAKDWASTFDMCMVLEEHMHHLRSVDWADCLDLMTFTRPAPHLKRISGIALGTIPVRFLDGQPGKLRVLNLPQLSLPPRLCPALSLVTHLTTSITDGHHTTWALTRLFEQFPNLEHVDLDIYINNASLLPVGTAPASLTTLRLNSMHGDSAYRTFNQIDLLAFSEAWRSPKLTLLDVSWFTMNAADIARVADGAIELSATDESEIGDRLFALLSLDNGMPAAEKYVVSGRRDNERLTAVLRFGPPASPTPDQIAHILAERTRLLAFLQLRQLTLSSAVLHAFAPHVGPGSGLPVLTELRVIVRPHLNELYQPHEFSWQSRLKFPWFHLACLPFAPQLCRVEVDVHTPERRRPGAADAEVLVGVLLDSLEARSCEMSSTNSEPLGVDVRISGFSHDVARGFHAPSQNHSTSIVFA